MTENYTALYEEHKKLGASFTDFAGWQMPLRYSSELRRAPRGPQGAGLFDLSHMGEIWVTGPQPARSWTTPWSASSPPSRSARPSTR